MPLREQWSTVEKVILVEKDLHDVPVMDEDNIWDYLDGAAKVEKRSSGQERTGKQLQSGGDWPQTTAKLP